MTTGPQDVMTLDPTTMNVVSRVAARQAASDADVRQAAATWMSSVMRTGGATPTPRP